MSRKKWFSLIALFCIVMALFIYSLVEKHKTAHDFFWIPLLLSAVFLVAANK